MSGVFHQDDLTPRYTLFPREIFRRDEEDRRRRCRWHRRGGLTKYPAEKIRGTAGVVRELCGLHVARACAGSAPHGAMASDSAGCGLDRSHDPALRARSRGARLPPFGYSGDSSRLDRAMGMSLEIPHTTEGSWSTPSAERTYQVPFDDLQRTLSARASPAPAILAGSGASPLVPNTTGGCSVNGVTLDLTYHVAFDGRKIP